MMKRVRIGAVPAAEVLHFLGWRGTPVEPGFLSQIERLCTRLDDTVEAGVMIRSFAYEQNEAKGTRFAPMGRDIASMLRGCHEIVLLAVTLGAESERMLLREQAKGAYEAMMLDAVMSAAVEYVCDTQESDLRRKMQAQGLYLTDRFSPGYGDMPLNQNADILEVLDAGRQMGLMTAKDGLMIPRKSVTAVMGISREEVPLRESGCSVCVMRDQCSLRRIR